MQLPQKTGTTPHATLQQKTRDWVNSIPTPQPIAPVDDADVITLSDSSDDDVPGQVDGAIDDVISDDDVMAIGQTDGAGDEKSSPPGKRRGKLFFYIIFCISL